MIVTPTQLRENIYKILDDVIETQRPIEISRKGQVVRLIFEQKKHPGKLPNIKAHPEAFCVDPDSFIQVDWSSN